MKQPDFLADGLSRGEVEFLHEEGQIDEGRYRALIEDLEQQEAVEDIRRLHGRSDA